MVGERAWKIEWWTMTEEQRVYVLQGGELDHEELTDNFIILHGVNFDQACEQSAKIIEKHEKQMYWYSTRIHLVEYAVEIADDGFLDYDWKTIDEPVEYNKGEWMPENF